MSIWTTHHANARTLTVELSYHGGIALRVSDDGHGFHLQAAPATGHFGLSGMRERAQVVGGELTVTSQPGPGATVQLLIKDVQ